MYKENIFTTPEEIQEKLKLQDEEISKLNSIVKEYPMAVPEYYLSLIDADDPDDPIFKMCIPSTREMDAGGRFDTSGEADNTVSLGLQHKYDETVLILSTNRCAMYCRHCFRKRLVGVSEDEVNRNFSQTVRYVSEHKEITNILVSGGDSFMMSNKMIERYLEAFTGMEHLDFIRFGTRIPVVMPDRVIEDEELQDIFRRYADKKQLFIVTQFNHPKELTDKAIECVRIFRKMGIIIRNQIVLLKGVNDDAATLSALLKKLTAAGVLPYYVFQCRPVKGVKNQFQVPLIRGAQIVDEAKAMQDGQAKGFRYCMSLPQGKVEILGSLGEGEMLFKFHQAKEKKDSARIFSMKVEPDQCWLNLTD